MPASSRSKRVLLYSHDSFGLGHVSRCRTIANAIVEADPAVSVLIVSGSPIIGSYEFRSGIDFVRIPGVIKQIDTGEYDSANLRVGVEHTLEMRTRIIRDTADIYRPDLFIVDKEPLGLRGEVGPTLKLLKKRSMTAGEIAGVFEITMGSLSHHYNVLKAADLVRSERRGQQIVYSLNTSVFEDVAALLADLFERKRT